MLHEINQIRWWLLNHVGFHVPDGSYEVPVNGKQFKVIVVDGRIQHAEAID